MIVLFHLVLLGGICANPIPQGPCKFHNLDLVLDGRSKIVMDPNYQQFLRRKRFTSDNSKLIIPGIDNDKLKIEKGKKPLTLGRYQNEPRSPNSMWQDIQDRPWPSAIYAVLMLFSFYMGTSLWKNHDPVVNPGLDWLYWFQTKLIINPFRSAPKFTLGPDERVDADGNTWKIETISYTGKTRFYSPLVHLLSEQGLVLAGMFILTVFIVSMAYFRNLKENQTRKRKRKHRNRRRRSHSRSASNSRHHRRRRHRSRMSSGWFSSMV